VDADCLIAGVLTSQGATSELLDRWQDGAFELVVSSRLIYEVRKALLSPRLADRYNIPVSDVEAFSRQLSEEGLFVDDPADPPRVMPDDPKDDYLVALALATGSSFLVTRDRHFDQVHVSGLRIVGPSDALGLLD
jgi:predicted nucleic acid-binding protein